MCPRQHELNQLHMMQVERLHVVAQAMRDFCAEGFKKMGWDKLAGAAPLYNTEKTFATDYTVNCTAQQEHSLSLCSRCTGAPNTMMGR